MPPATPRVALVQDHIAGRGGGERVLLTMARAFPDAPIHTSFFRPGVTYPEFDGLDVRPSLLNRFGPVRNHHRSALPVFPLLFQRMRIDADVVICGNAGWSQGVTTPGRKIIYFHAMASWLYRPDHYLRDKGPAARAGLAALRPWLRRWDQRTGRSGHRYLVQGRSMQARVAAAYDADVEILPPPLGLDAAGPQRPAPVEPGYFLCVTRLVSYKNPDLVVQAFNQLPDERLVIAGDGPERARLEAMAGPNITLFGNAVDEELRWLYSNCRALVAAGVEPYGLTPVEAAAFGKGTIALARDGLLDTMTDGETGVLFDAETAGAIRDAVRGFSDASVRRDALERLVAAHAEEAFASRLMEIVAEEAARATDAGSGADSRDG